MKKLKKSFRDKAIRSIVSRSIESDGEMNRKRNIPVSSDKELKIMSNIKDVRILYSIDNVSNKKDEEEKIKIEATSMAGDKLIDTKFKSEDKKAIINLARKINVNKDKLMDRINAVKYNNDRKATKYMSIAVMYHDGFLYSSLSNKELYDSVGKFFSREDADLHVKVLCDKLDEIPKNSRRLLLSNLLDDSMNVVRDILRDISESEAVYLYLSKDMKKIKDTEVTSIDYKYGNHNNYRGREELLDKMLVVLNSNAQYKRKELVKLLEIKEEVMLYLYRQVKYNGDIVRLIYNSPSLNQFNSFTNEQLPTYYTKGSGLYKKIAVTEDMKNVQCELGRYVTHVPRHINKLRNILIEQSVELEDEAKLSRVKYNLIYSSLIREATPRFHMQRVIGNLLRNVSNKKDGEIPITVFSILVSSYINYLVNFRSFQGDGYALSKLMTGLIIDKIVSSKELNNFLDSYDHVTTKSIKEFKMTGKELTDYKKVILRDLREYYSNFVSSIIREYDIVLSNKKNDDYYKENKNEEYKKLEYNPKDVDKVYISDMEKSFLFNANCTLDT